MKTIERKQKEGFTLVETLVAIAIITIGLTAPLTLAFNTLRSSGLAVDQAVAYYLAQEGIEYIRGVRDTNNLESDAWLDVVAGACTALDPCDIRNILSGVANSGDIIDCPGAGCRPIEFDGDRYDGRGMGGTANDTHFTRSIVINIIAVDREAEIVSTVTWTRQGVSSSIVVTDRIFNWAGFI